MWRQTHACYRRGHPAAHILCPQVPEIEQAPLHDQPLLEASVDLKVIVIMVVPINVPIAPIQPVFAVGFAHTDPPTAKVGNLTRCKVLPYLYPYYDIFHVPIL